MKKVSAAEIAKQVQKLYAPKDKNKNIISTGASLRRPTKEEDFVVVPEEHPWRELTGLMGLPYDIVTQIAGATDSGKSTIAGQFLAYAQKQGVYTVLWDTEKKFDKNRFEQHFGGTADDLLVVTSTQIRKGAGAMLKYVKVIIDNDPKAKILLVQDSVGGGVSRNRAELDMDDEKNTQPGSEAVENSNYMRHIIATMDKYPGQVALLLINQLTDNIGITPGKSRPGGKKIGFHSSMIIEMTRVQDLTKTVKGKKLKTGIISRAKIAKNHLSMTEHSVHEMRVKVDAAGWHSMDDSAEGDSNE